MGLPHSMLNTYELVAGAGSRALLHYMDALHNTRTARIARGLLNFDLTIVYVDEGAAQGLTPDQSAAQVASVAAAVSQYQPTFQFISVPLEDVYTLSPASATQTADKGHGNSGDPRGVCPADHRHASTNNHPPRTSSPSSLSESTRLGNGCAPPQDYGLGYTDCTASPAGNDGAVQAPEGSDKGSGGSAGNSNQFTSPSTERRLRLQRLLKVRLCAVPVPGSTQLPLAAPSALHHPRHRRHDGETVALIETTS